MSTTSGNKIFVSYKMPVCIKPRYDPVMVWYLLKDDVGVAISTSALIACIIFRLPTGRHPRAYFFPFKGGYRHYFIDHDIGLGTVTTHDAHDGTERLLVSASCFSLQITWT